MLWDLFSTFFKIGLFTFGGGYAMIAQCREVIVESKKWLTEDDFFQIITIAESTQGPVAINTATYVGYKKNGVIGSVCATLGTVLPSMMIIFIISLFLEEFMKNQYVAYAFVGIKCAVAFLIMRAGMGMLTKMEKKPLPVITFTVVLAAMIIFEIFAVSFSSIFFILTGGFIGIFVYSILDAKKEGNTK